MNCQNSPVATPTRQNPSSPPFASGSRWCLVRGCVGTEDGDAEYAISHFEPLHDLSSEQWNEEAIIC